MSVANDTFTEAADTQLENHTSDSGHTWFVDEETDADAVVAEAIDQLKLDSLGTRVGLVQAYLDVTPVTSDYKVSADVKIDSTVDAADIAVIGRRTGLDDFYKGSIVAATDVAKITKEVAGTETELASTAFTVVAGTTYEIELRILGDSLELRVDGVLQVSATDTDITATGKPGIRGETPKSSDGDTFYDNFVVSEFFSEAAISDVEIEPSGVDVLVFVESGISDVEIVPSGIDAFVFVDSGISDVEIQPLGISSFIPAFAWATRDVAHDDSLAELVTMVEIAENIINLNSGSPSEVAYKGILQNHPEAREETTESLFGLRTSGELDFRITNKYGDITESDDLSGKAARVSRLQNGSWESIYVGEIARHDIGLNPRFFLHDLIKTVFHEKVGRVITTDLYPNAKDVGKRINIPFGRVARLECANIEWDDTNRIYRWAVGEGKGHGGADWNEVTTAYKQDVAFKQVTGTVVASTANTITLETADRRPDDFFKWFWVFISGQTPRFVTNSDDDGTNTILTVDSDFDSVPEAGVDTYTVREWRNYLDSNDIMILEFKKRFINGSRILPIFADVDALQAEKNFVRLAQSAISNQVWGKGLTVNETQFDRAASLSEITALLSEGNIIGESLIDVLSEILKVRGMDLKNTDSGIGIEVDTAKNSVGTFTYDNILKGTLDPGIEMLKADRKTKELTAQYRWDFRKKEFLREDITRQANSSGESRGLPLKYVYSADTADRILDYLRKEEQSRAKFLSFAGMKDFPVKRRDRISILAQVVIGEEVTTGGGGFGSLFGSLFGSESGTTSTKTRDIINSDWHIVDYADDKQSHIIEKANQYIAAKYTYEATSPLPTEENLPVPPDFENTPPDPLANFAVNFDIEIGEGGNTQPFAVLTFDPPEENYSETSILVRLSSATEFEEVGRGFDRVRIAPGWVGGEIVDILGIPWNEDRTQQGLPSLLESQVVPGDTTVPKVPANFGKDQESLSSLSWKWDQVTQNTDNSTIEDLWGYQWQLGNSDMSVIDKQGFTTDLRKEINIKDSGNLSSTTTKHLRVRAIDEAWKHTDGNLGNASSWTSIVSASTKSVKKEDMPTNEITNKASFSNTASISVSPVASVTLTLLGTFPVKIRFRATMDGSAGLILSIERNGTIIYQDAATSAYEGAAAIDFQDNSPPAGSTTYDILAGNNPGLSNRNMDVLEVKR